MHYRVLSVVAVTLFPGSMRLAQAGEPNVLDPKEKASGWQLLFDGKSPGAWRGFKSDRFPEKGWKVTGGLLIHEKGVKAGDIVTRERFDNFEFQAEFRLTPRANSGIKYLVDENLVKQGRAGVGFEYQVLDDELHPDAKLGKDGNRTCGGLYDLIAPGSERVVKPVGEWNEARIVVNGNKIEHWLNGKRVLSFVRGSPEFKRLIAESKFKQIPGFGDTTRGHILLQDHEDEVAFRNIKIRRLPAHAASR
jgi:hypothetical protein